MKKTFTRLHLFLLLVFSALSLTDLLAQCANNGVFIADATPIGIGVANATSLTCVYGGDVYSFTAVSGYTYTLATCGTTWDTQLTLSDAGGVVLGYDDDSVCSLRTSSITWTATFSGVVYVQVNLYNCITNTTCGNLTITASAGGVVNGCTDPTATNYDPNATVDDGSCIAELICDCAGTQHAVGVLTWIGDGFSDISTYTYNGQFVDFNCATWGYDCGDIVGAPLDDPYSVCLGNRPPNNGCGIVDIFGCTDPLANNYNASATVDDASCTYSFCSNLAITAQQLPCIWNVTAGALLPSVAFIPTFDGACTITQLYLNINGTEYPFDITAPNNTSGSVLPFNSFTAGSTFSMYYVLSDGTASEVFDFIVGDCLSDPIICDCSGNAHTIGVLNWLGDTYADASAYTWAGTAVDFNCATWGYDCGDIVGAAVEDPYGVCSGNLPPNNGCFTIDVPGCMDVLANNYNPAATIDDGSCAYSCSNLAITAQQLPCIWSATAAALLPSVAFTPTFDGACTITQLYLIINGTEYPFDIAAPNNTSGSVLPFNSFTAGSTFGVYFVLSDGTASVVFDFVVGDCLSDPIICDCSGNAHTIGVLNWLGDTYADASAYTWAGTAVDFNCATWGYDCGDIVGAPVEDPYGVCSGNLPPNNGCFTIDVPGCMDVLANNYNATATVDDGSCTYDVLGCTNAGALNYNPAANVDNGSCIYSLCANSLITGVQMPCIQDANGVLNPSMMFTYTYSGLCTVDSLVVVYGIYEYSFAQVAPNNVSGSSFSMIGFPANSVFGAYLLFADGSQSQVFNFAVTDCTQDELICDCSGNVHTIGVLSWLGDTYGDASAYTWDGTLVDFNCATWGYDCGDIVGSPLDDPNGVCSGNMPPNNGCSADVIFGCTNITANNYNADATLDDGSCTFDIPGCTYPTASNYNPAATVDDGSCNFDVLGCTYVTANNYNPAATLDDGSCTFDVLGCMDATANNYNSLATADDGSCTYDVYGCTDPTANNYNAAANISDNSCTYDVAGCTDPLANNYNPLATVNDGSCTYDVVGCTDPTALNYNPDANVNDGSCIYSTCSNLVLTGQQTPCVDINGVLNPTFEFTFTYDGDCTVSRLWLNFSGQDSYFDIVAPSNVSGSVFPLEAILPNLSFTAYFVLSDGTQSEAVPFSVGDCSQDPIICDCDGNEHTIGVLTYLGDTYADNGTYAWAGVAVNFNCATWGYDCGDIVGAPAEDPYGVCSGNLPPLNGCITSVTEHSDMTSLEAYPNPTSGALTLVAHSGSEMKQISVFDQSGKLLLTEQRVMIDGVAQSLDLSGFAAGSYHVQMVGIKSVENISIIIQK
jgi:hypothetical protein